MEILYISLK